MPELKRFGSISLRMYPDDHAPPHFHLVGPAFQVLVRISDLEVVAGSVRNADIREPLRWAEANRASLIAKWTELNERN